MRKSIQEFNVFESKFWDSDEAEEVSGDESVHNGTTPREMIDWEHATSSVSLLPKISSPAILSTTDILQ